MVSSLTTTSFALAASLALFDVSSPLSLAHAAVPVDYNPQLMMRNACKDDPEFRFKNQDKKSCAWIKNLRKQQKKRRFCNKNKVRKSCPETCQVEDCKNGSPVLPEVDHEVDHDHDAERINGGGGFKTTCPSFPTSMLARGGVGVGVDSVSPLTKFVDPSTGATVSRGEGPWDCSDYVDGLMCFSDYHYTTTCGPTGKGSGDLICSPRKQFVCNGKTNAWEASYVQAPMCAVQDPREIESESNDVDAIARFDNLQRLMGMPCSVQECPIEKPTPGSSCSDYTGKYDCHYNYQINSCGFGFGDDQHDTSDGQCLPIERYKCGSGYGSGSGSKNQDGVQVEKTWQLTLMAMPACPAGTRRSTEKCDPTRCPAREPVDGSDCTDYQGTDECNYDYKVAGCTPDTQQCSPTKYYTCEEDVLEIGSPSATTTTTTLYHTKRWKLNYPLVPACWAEGNGESCDPKGCPVVPPEPGSDCSGYFANNANKNGSNSKYYGSRCDYNYRYDGCTLDDLKCVPIDLYTCDPLDRKWHLAKRSLSSRTICPGANEDDEERDPVRNVLLDNDQVAIGPIPDPPTAMDKDKNFSTDFLSPEELARNADQNNSNNNNVNERVAVPPTDPVPPTAMDKDKNFSTDFVPPEEVARNADENNNNNVNERVAVPPPDPVPPVAMDKDKIFYYDPAYPVQRQSKNGEALKQLAVVYAPEDEDKLRNSAPVVIPRGKPCRACPTVLPAVVCPPIAPRGGDPCTELGYPEGILCSYDFRYEGPDEYQLECVPKMVFKCAEPDGWIPRMM